jgi:hypothetical protein
VLGVSTIAIDPGNPDVMYIGTGEGYSYEGSDGGEVNRLTRGSYGIGILKTQDGGVSWTHSLDWTYNQSRGVWMIQIDPTNTGRLYAATTEGVYKSVDAGGSWSLVNPVPMATDVRIQPGTPSVVWAAHGNFGTTGHGIYRSTNSGQNWTKLAAGLPASWTGKVQLAISPIPPYAAYASVANAEVGVGLYRWNSLQSTWTQVNATDYASYQGWYSHYVVLSPFSAQTLFTGGIEIWRSTNGGASLNQRSSQQSAYYGTLPPEGPLGGPDYAHPDNHFALWHPTDPNTIYFASDGGIFCTTDLGITFQSLIGGYQTSQFYNGFSNSASSPSFAMGGLQDNNSVIYHGTSAWERVIGGDGTYSAMNPVVGTTIYGAYQYLSIQRSYDSGGNWTPIDPPWPADDPTAFVAPYVLSPSEPSVLYGGRSRVYKSEDEGTSWTETNGGNPLSSGNPVISLAVAPSTAAVAYAGTAPVSGRARLYRTRDRGSSWLEVTGSLPDRFPSDIAIDPHDPDRVLVTLMGFGSSHVFLSENGGDSWADIGAGLPDIPSSAVLVDPDYPEVFYVGTDLGIYVSLDAGASWQPFNNGMPLAMVNDLTVFLPDRKIRAATHGNGAYERPLFGPGACASPGEVTDLRLSKAGADASLSWSAAAAGVAPIRYDVLSSRVPSEFETQPSASCVESNGVDTSATDASVPAPGEIIFYLIRAESICGPGSLGSASSGAPRSGMACPGA